jgi:hypothetical protein
MRLIFKVQRAMPLSFDEEVVILEGRYGYVRLILPLDHGLRVGQELALTEAGSQGNVDRLKDLEERSLFPAFDWDTPRPIRLEDT